MNNKRRSNGQLARDRRRIADLYLQGWLQIDIADEIGVNQSTVSRDIKALQSEWLKSTLIDFNEAKANELAKIDRVEREYWTAWKHSCEDAETIRQEGNKNTGVDKIVKTAKGQAGDPRFLTGLQWCINRRCKIFGFDAPIKTQETNKQLNVNLDNLTTDELETMLAIWDKLDNEGKAPAQASD